MHLIFIRHGDPDYDADYVTSKGLREIELLGKRLADLKPDEVFASPMGRAQVTAESCLKNFKSDLTGEPLRFTTLDWLHEFDFTVTDPLTKQKKCAWDWKPMQYFTEKKYFDVKKWFLASPMKKAHIGREYRRVCDGIDEVLRSYDYTRFDKDIPAYNCFSHLDREDLEKDTHILSSQKDVDDRTLVFVCHFGVTCAVLSHLLGISPVILWQGFFSCPTGITIVNSEEREPGLAAWRVQCMGDSSHLSLNGEKVSDSGFFGHCVSL